MFAFTLNGKQIEHPCYVIPDLNEPLILGIDFIQHHHHTEEDDYKTLYIGVVAMEKDIKEQMARLLPTKMSMGNRPAVLAYTRQARGGGIRLEPHVSRVLLSVEKTFKPRGNNNHNSSRRFVRFNLSIS